MNTTIDDILAQYENGILTINILKKAVAKENLSSISVH